LLIIVGVYHIRRRHFWEDHSIHIHRHETLKSNMGVNNVPFILWKCGFAEILSCQCS